MINALAIEVGFDELTRVFTVPLRLFVCSLCIAYSIILLKKITYNFSVIVAFSIFWALYFYRIIESSVSDPDLLTRSGSEFVLFSISFGVIPFLYFYSIMGDQDRYLTKHGIVIGSVLLSVVTLIFYRELLGSDFGRAGGIKVDENKTIGALALSYSATILMGVSLYDMNYLKTRPFLNLLYFLLGCVPFALGASRGAVIAVLVSLIFVLLIRGNLIDFARLLFIVIVLSPVAYILIENSGSDLFERLGTIEGQLDPKETRNTWNRIFIWRTSFYQFLENPWFGDFLENRARGHHPHNILIESLMTTGIVGTVPFCYLILKAFRKCVKILRNRPEFGWMVIVFVQSFTMNMFSGGIFGAIWFWSSAGFVLSVKD